MLVYKESRYGYIKSTISERARARSKRALFGLEYDRYENEHAEIFESSDRAFEEEVMLAGFSTAPTKSEGGAVSFDDAQETFTARYTT